MNSQIFNALQTGRQNKQPMALVSDLKTGGQLILNPQSEIIAAGGTPPQLSAEQTAAVLELLRNDRSRRLADSDIFVQVHNPPPRLIIIGAVHIAQALAPMAAIANYAVSIIDPRGAFATAERFPGVSLNDDWPDEAMIALAPDTQTAVVTLTHDPKLDDPALMVALRSPAFYITSLGSRRTHGKRVERLTAAGMEAENLARLHAPAGLDIGAMSPAEIAISIMAQMTAARHGRSTTFPGR